MSVRKSLAVLLVSASTLLGLVAVAPAASAAPEPGTVAAALTKLRVAPELLRTGYTREAFRHWTDADGDCRGTRTEVLQQETTVRPLTWTDASQCVVARGRWWSFMDGATWTNPADVDIDHLIALAEAWDSGARNWGPVRRQNFANDLAYAGSLNAITDDVNSAKGDRDPAQWLPPRVEGRCRYVATWIAVKWRWSLAVDATEKAALDRFAAGPCGSAALTLPAKVPFPSPTTSPTTPPPVPADVDCSDFSTQAAAQTWFNKYFPHYGDIARLDADGDRIACETLP